MSRVRDTTNQFENAAYRGEYDLVKSLFINKEKASCKIEQENLDRALYYTCKDVNLPGTNICGKWNVVKFLIAVGANLDRCFEKEVLSARSMISKHHCERGQETRKIISAIESKSVFTGISKDLEIFLEGQEKNVEVFGCAEEMATEAPSDSGRLSHSLAFTLQSPPAKLSR